MEARLKANTSPPRETSYRGLAREEFLTEALMGGEEEDLLHPALVGNLIEFICHPDSQGPYHPTARHITSSLSPCHNL